MSNKFTEIMKTNGVVVAPKIIKKPKISTDPTELVEMITKSLNPTVVPALEIVSSESDSEGIIDDVDSPDVAVIEDELNLEDLMKQKALLQARLGDIVSESDNEDEHRPVLKSKKPVSDVILLDDSSGEALMRKSATSKKRQKSVQPCKEGKQAAAAVLSRERRETSRERYLREERERQKMRRSDVESRRSDVDVRRNDIDVRRNDMETRRSDGDNRFKEDLRREIDRVKGRGNRDREQRGRREMDRPAQQQQQQQQYGNRLQGRDRSRYSMERGDRRGNQRSRSRDRYDRGTNRDRSRDRDRYQQRRGKGEEKKDKFVGSLSEGQKPEKDTSSESDYGELDMKVNVDDDDDEERIIELRRKKREELLKKLSDTNSNAIESFDKYDNDEDVQFVPQTPTNGTKYNKSPEVAQVQTPPVKAIEEVAPNEDYDMIDSTTPPLPPGMQLKLAVATIIEEEKMEEDEVGDKLNKGKDTGSKRNDWDMFAEQDIDSNFDVSTRRISIVTHKF